MIYFDNEKNAYGFEIENPLCVIEEDLWMEYAGTDKWDIIDGVFTDITDTQEYIDKQSKKEKERISHLKCTKRVFALALKQLGITYQQLKDLIATDDDAQLEWDLCVELERCNPSIDKLASQLGVTSQQIDEIFKYANGEIQEEREEE